MVLNIHPTAQVAPGAVLGSGVTVGPFAVIGPEVVLGANCNIGNNVTLAGRVVMGEDNVIFAGASIGLPPQDRSAALDIDSAVRIGRGNVFREYVTVHRASKVGEATIIGDNNLLMANVHIAHDCNLSNNINIANVAALAGFVEVGEGVFISAFCGIHQFCSIGRFAMVGGYSKIQKDLPPYSLANGQPALVYGINTVGLRRQGMEGETRKNIKQAFKYIYNSNLNTKQALTKIKEELGHVPECNILVDFIEISKRGIIKKTPRDWEE